MAIADRVTAAEAELLSVKDALVEATKALEAAPYEEALLVQVEELSSQVEKKSATVEALKKAEAALAERAKPVAAAAVVSQVKRDGKGNGDLLFKMAAANFIAYAQRKDVSQVIEERYKGHADLAAAHDYVAKSVVNPAMTSTVGWAQELVQSDTQGFLDTLRTVSVAAELASRSQRLSFGGYDSITIPMRNPLGATLTEPAWVN